MYLVDCPNCGRSLHMKRAVSEAKLKCRYCQAVFIGSTRLASDAAPPEPAEPALQAEASPTEPTEKAPPVRPRRRPRRSAWPAVIALIGLAAAVVLGAWAYHNYRQRQPLAPTSQPAPAGVTTPQNAPAKPAVVAPSPPAEEPPAPEPPVEKEDQEQTKAIHVIECARLEEPDEASATFVGKYENSASEPLRWVQVAVTVKQADGKLLRAFSEKYKNIPPGWEGQFSIEADFRFEPGMRIVETLAQSEPAPGTRGWALKRWRRDIADEKAVRITGEATNTTDQPLADPVVLCDFFTRRGVYVGSVRGKFRSDVQTLAPGETATYDVFFDPQTAGSFLALLDEPQLRLLGTTKRP